MATFKKAILKAGQVYHSPDGKVNVTPERLSHWAAEFSKLTGNGHVVPIDWDHAADLAHASPIALSEYKKRRSAKNTVGKMAAFNVAADGQSAEVLLDITDPQAQGRAERNEVYVSPVIFESWTDGAKNAYSDVITHVDIVNHPVDHSQGPFVAAEPGTVALGIRMGLGGVYRLGDNPFAKDMDKDADKDDDGDVDSADKLIADDDKNDDMPKVEGDDKIAEAIRAHLDQLGAALPADWSFNSDAADQILLTALKTLVKANQKAEAESNTDEDDDDQGDDDMGKVADPGFAAMSLASRNALAYAEREHRKGIQSRLDAVLSSGQCTGDEHTKRREAVVAVRLSLDDQGAPILSDLEKWLDSREAVPAGTFWTPEQRTAAQRMSIVEPGAHQHLSGDAEADENGRRLAGLVKKK